MKGDISNRKQYVDIYESDSEMKYLTTVDYWSTTGMHPGSSVIHDLHELHGSNMFYFIIYSDDTTLFTLLMK